MRAAFASARALQGRPRRSLLSGVSGNNLDLIRSSNALCHRFVPTGLVTARDIHVLRSNILSHSVMQTQKNMLNRQLSRAHVNLNASGVPSFAHSYALSLARKATSSASSSATRPSSKNSSTSPFAGMIRWLAEGGKQASGDKPPKGFGQFFPKNGLGSSGAKSSKRYVQIVGVYFVLSCITLFCLVLLCSSP